MGALLESGMVGNIGLKHLRVIKEDTIKKWDDLGFLEGLNGHQKDNIAQLYENQASYTERHKMHTVNLTDSQVMRLTQLQVTQVITCTTVSMSQVIQ